MKNHLGETIYSSFSGWKRMIKKRVYALIGNFSVKFDGDIDICEGGYVNSFGIYKSLGQWDGETGSIIN